MATALNSLPPLPDGFTLDRQSSDIPPLPDGFTLDGSAPVNPGRAQFDYATRDMGEVDPATGKTRAQLEGEMAQANQPKSWKERVLEKIRPVAREGLRQVGQKGQWAAEGGLSTVTIPADLLGRLMNFALDKSGSDVRVGDNLTGQLHQALSDPTIDAATPGERIAGDIVRNAAGAATGAGAFGALAKGAQVTRNVTAPLSGATAGTGERVLGVLAEGPAMQVAGAATGSAAAGITRESGGGKGAQLAAGLIGGMAPSVIGRAAQAGTQLAFRGGEQGRQTAERNLKSFEQAGTLPTVGQLTEKRRTQALESVLAKAPGGAGRMAATAEQQAAQISTKVDKQAGKLAPISGADETGEAITRGIRGEGGFIDEFKATQAKLYDKLDEAIPAQAAVDVSNARKALAALNADIPGAENLSKQFKNSRIRSIQGDLEKDLEASLSGQTLPYEAVKKLRTLVGNEMADAGLMSDVPRSKWKALYAALSEDLLTAAEKAGPQAKQAWARATNYTRSGMQRIDLVERAIDKAGGPEAIYKATTSGTSEGATTLRAVMQSLPKDAQKTLSATVLRRLGRATAGVQNDVGDAFSTETFLTSWNKLSPAAKRTLFDRFGADYRQNVDEIAKVANNIRKGNQVFKNPSGTAQAAANYGTYGGLALSLLGGNLGTAAGIGAGIGATNLTARVMTNPTFVRWLATHSKTPATALPVALNQLMQQGIKDDDQDLQDVAAAMSQALAEQTGEGVQDE